MVRSIEGRKEFLAAFVVTKVGCTHSTTHVTASFDPFNSGTAYGSLRGILLGPLQGQFVVKTDSIRSDERRDLIPKKSNA